MTRITLLEPHNDPWPIIQELTLATRYKCYEDIPRSVRIALARAVPSQHQITPPPSRDDLIEFWGITGEWLDRILQEITPQESGKSKLDLPPDAPKK
jgi:hypothetical protein